jgi:predicted ATPase
MVGRSQALAALDAVLGRAPAVVLVAGDAGIGKTRLVREFTAAAEATVLWGDCVPMQAGELPYAPFTAALRPRPSRISSRRSSSSATARPRSAPP